MTTFDDLPPVLYSAHRGGAGESPENSWRHSARPRRGLIAFAPMAGCGYETAPPGRGGRESAVAPCRSGCCDDIRPDRTFPLHQQPLILRLTLRRQRAGRPQRSDVRVHRGGGAHRGGRRKLDRHRNRLRRGTDNGANRVEDERVAWQPCTVMAHAAGLDAQPLLEHALNRTGHVPWCGVAAGSCSLPWVVSNLSRCPSRQVVMAWPSCAPGREAVREEGDPWAVCGPTAIGRCGCGTSLPYRLTPREEWPSTTTT
ncbi:hypothetical protein SAMN02787144_100941 [Streptomyces atratus]|uniref:Uncharacterized protein n=1 Tax=Streptomyces atratus TaxID=1893 RepID=A0A1K2BM30_STRAR|nr:hypothetical protein SAMN02787144_100941 [Streptomyces atratus]